MPIHALVNTMNAHARSQEGQAWIAEAREIIKLGTPLIITQLSQMAVMTTDVILIGQLGAEQLGAATLGLTMFFFGWLLGFGPSAAVAPIVAQALGKNPGDRQTPTIALVNGLWLALLCSIPVWGLFAFVEPALIFIGQEPGLARDAAAYTHAIQWGLPFAIGFMTLRSFAMALSSPRAALVATALMIIVNAALNYAMIFGHWGFPAMGAVGSGYASALANVFAFAVLFAWICIRPPFRQYAILKADWFPSAKSMKELIWLGLPIGMMVMFEGGLFNAGVILMGFLGPVALAAHQIAINFASVTFMTALGLAMAGTVRVGLAAGAGDADGVRRSGYTVMVLAAGMMSLCALVMAFFPGTIANLYLGADAPNYDSVVSMATTFLLIAAFFQVFDALQVAGAMALRGLKDAHVPMVLTGISYWLIGFPACYGLAFWAGWGGVGIWVGYVIALGVAAVLLCHRFWRMAARPMVVSNDRSTMPPETPMIH